MRLSQIIVMFVAAAGLAGCGSLGGTNQSSWGNQFGNAVPVVSGEEASTAIAVLLNNDFGRALEPSDHKAVAQAQKRALRARGNGVAVAWQNEATGRSGQVRPGPVYSVNDTTCREVTHLMILNGSQLTARGTACREKNGTWKTLG